MGYLFVWSGSLWMPIIAHFVNNMAIVGLTFLYSSDLFTINPNNIGANDDNALPVFVSAVMCAFLLLHLFYRERNSKWFDATVVPTHVDPLDYEKKLIDYFDIPVEKARVAESPNHSEVKEEVVQAPTVYAEKKETAVPGKN